MTLTPESSERGPALGPYAAIESLAGVFHPHAIEVQDFPHYGLVIDLRSAAEYADDHIPGALRVDPTGWPAGPLTTRHDADSAPPLAVHEPSRLELPDSVAAAVAHVRLDQAILVYCGQGGLLSSPVAQALRWRGWTVDVLHGGWINYRRWVLAGLELLPRLVRFRVLACTLGSETARVLAALRSLGHQVLDLEALAGSRRFALAARTHDQLQTQPAQAWFDSQLLQALRATDPSRALWVADTGPKLGAIALPGALNDALAIAPAAMLQASMATRASAWAEDEPLCVDADALIAAVASLGAAPSATVIARWRDLGSQGFTGPLLESLLAECLDPAYQAERAQRATRQHALSPLVVDSLAATPIAEALRLWPPSPAAELPPATT
jgi:tRNA 2-selenouridine synthase